MSRGRRRDRVFSGEDWTLGIAAGLILGLIAASVVLVVLHMVGVL